MGPTERWGFCGPDKLVTPRTGLFMRPPNWTLGWGLGGGQSPHKGNGTEEWPLAAFLRSPQMPPPTSTQAPAPQQPESSSWSFEW